MFLVALSIFIWKSGWQLFHPLSLAWDGAVYTGMAKYLLSQGNVGLWEAYRPPLLPLLFAIGPLINIPLLFWAKVLSFSTATGALLFMYKIGERYQKYAGAVGATILASMAFFTDFALTPTTEIFGMCGFLAAFYVLFLRRSYLFGGVLTALLFIMRFPYGLLIPLFAIAIALLLYQEKRAAREIAEKMSLYAIGVAILIFPYLVSNIVFYGDAFQIFFTGQRVIRLGNHIYQEPFYYYVLIIVAACPSVFFSSFAVRNNGEKTLAVLWYVVLSFFLYFSLLTHKEDRYILHALPAVVLLTAIGIARLWEQGNTLLRIAAVILISIELVIPYHAMIRSPRTSDIEAIYRSFTDYPYGTEVLTTSPLISEYAEVKVIPMYTYLNTVETALKNSQNKGKVFYINTCDIVDPDNLDISQYGFVERREVRGGCQIYIGKGLLNH